MTPNDHMRRFLLHPLVGLITFALGVGAMFLVMTASQNQGADVAPIADVLPAPESVSIPAIEPEPQDSYVVSSAQKIMLTKASRTFDVVVDPDLAAETINAVRL